MAKGMTNHQRLALVITALAAAADFSKAGLDENENKALKHSLSSIFIDNFVSCMDDGREITEKMIDTAYEVLTEFLGEPMNWFCL